MTTFNTTQNYNRYWRDHAQFFPPCDHLEGPELEPFKQLGSAIFEDQQNAIDEAKTEADGDDAEVKTSFAEERMEKLVNELRSILTNPQRSKADIISEALSRLP